MKLLKRITENIRWTVDEYCCDKMENAIIDGFIYISMPGQILLSVSEHRITAKNGNFVYYCPFCGEKIEGGKGGDAWKAK